MSLLNPQILILPAQRFLQRGFSLFETLLVMSLSVLLVGTVSFYGHGFFLGRIFSTDKDLILDLFRQARSNSLANLQGSSWGVYVDNSSYVLFAGDTYDAGSATNVFFSASSRVGRSGMREVVFSRLSGRARIWGGDLVLSLGDYQSTISINEEGQINWTN